MLEESIRKYQNRSIETAQVIAELIKLAKEMREAHQRGNQLGLTDDEIAFYDALEVNDSAVKVLGDGTFASAVHYPAGAGPSSVAIRDLDGDQVPDLAVANFDSGNVSVLLNQSELPGDLNCDGAVNAFDIDPFVLALTDPAGYEQQYPDCDINLADINGDGTIDAFDIDPFVELLVGG